CPELDCGHRRLCLEGSEGVDHTNPTSWKGDVIVGNVSLLTVWNAGRNEAIRILAKAGVPNAAEAFTFQANLSKSDGLPLNIDMLRPEGAYVGLCESEEEAAHLCADAICSHSESLELKRTQDAGTAEGDTESEIDTVLLEDFIPETVGEDPNGIFSKARLWLDIDGTPIHKASAVRILLGTDEGLKSTDQLRRVRGYSRNFGVKNSINDDDVAGNLFMVGQMVAGFLQVGSNAVLSLLKVTAIQKEGGHSISCIALSELKNPKLTFRGQILSLKLHGSAHWHWTGDWEVLETAQGKKALSVASNLETKLSKCVLLVDMPAFLTRPINPPLTETTPITPELETSVLEALTDCLWPDVAPHAKAIPIRPVSASFPYRRYDGSFAFINADAVQMIDQLPSEGEEECFLCNERVQLNRMQDHVAMHLAAARFGLQDDRAVNVRVHDDCL
ncbi:hypothetical protein EWM64_g5369, partial [Hericium alpestre]